MYLYLQPPGGGGADALVRVTLDLLELPLISHKVVVALFSVNAGNALRGGSALAVVDEPSTAWLPRSSCQKQLPVIAKMVLARFLVMPFNDFVSFGKAKAGVASRCKT